MQYKLLCNNNKHNNKKKTTTINTIKQNAFNKHNNKKNATTINTTIKKMQQQKTKPNKMQQQ